MRHTSFIRILATMFLLGSNISHAQTVYVIDQLLVGVHADKNLESAIVKVLPTGTMLEVLERDGELARIKDNQGTEGWIDSAYLMNNPPARMMVERLERANAALQKQLEVATAATNNQAQQAAGSVGEKDQNAIDSLTKENTELKRKLSTEMVNSAKLTERISDYEARLSDKPLSPAETQVTELEKTVTKLKRELENILQENKRLKASSQVSLSQMMPEVRVDTLTWPIVVGLVIVLCLAYGAGIYTMDYLNRRRHGGFRV